MTLASVTVSPARWASPPCALPAGRSERSRLVSKRPSARRISSRLHDPGEDVGRVIELHDLGDRLNGLLFVVPLVVGGILVGKPGGPRLSGRVVYEVILVVVDQHDRSNLHEPLLVGVQEAAQLLRRLVEEVPSLELRLLGELTQRIDPGRAHGLYTKSGPIRSRRKMMC